MHGRTAALERKPTVWISPPGHDNGRCFRELFGHPDAWKEVRQLELYCRQRKLPFSLNYWASGYPSLEKHGLADDSTWYVAIMQQGYDYASGGGRPDQVVIERWIGAPSRCTPETDEWTFTRSVRDFARKFARQPAR